MIIHQYIINVHSSTLKSKIRNSTRPWMGILLPTRVVRVCTASSTLSGTLLAKPAGITPRYMMTFESIGSEFSSRKTIKQ